MRRTAAALTGLALTATACGGPTETAQGDCGTETIRLSFIASNTSTWQAAADEFADQVAQGTDDRVTVETYSDGQLAGADQQAELEQTQQGVIDSLWVSPIILALFMDQRFDVYSLPFLFPDHETANTVVDGEVGDMTEEWLREGQLEPLGWGVNGFRELTNNQRPVTEPADLEGLKVRVAGTDMYLRTFQLMGADPVTMNFGEVFTSLEQGVIEGQENPLSIISSSSLNEVQDHLTLWKYSYDPLVLAMNADAFAGFCADDQQVLRDSAAAAGELQRELALQEDEELPQELADAGMEVVEYDDVDIEAFRDAVVDTVYSEWESVIGAEEMETMLQAVEEAEQG